MRIFSGGKPSRIRFQLSDALCAQAIFVNKLNTMNIVNRSFGRHRSRRAELGGVVLEEDVPFGPTVSPFATSLYTACPFVFVVMITG